MALVLGASTGGIGRHVLGLARRLVAQGHQVQLFCPPQTSRLHGFDGLGINVRRLTQLPRARGADVVHAHGYKAIVLAAALTRPGGPPLVGSWHNAILADGAPGFVGRMLQRASARSADLTLGASSDLVRAARERGARRAELAPVAAAGGVWLAYSPAETRQRLRHELAASDKTVVLSVGRLAAQKNHPMLLDVAAAFRDEEVEFWIVGDGPERAALQHRIDRDRLPVRLLGARSAIEVMYAADVFVMTSRWEARALVVQEAMTTGLPVVATDVGGIPELTGDAALLVPSGGVVEARAALRRVLDEPALAEQLRAAGRARAATWPDQDQVAAQLVASYRSVLGR